MTNHPEVQVPQSTAEEVTLTTPVLKEAVALEPRGQAALLAVLLSLEEIGCIAASLQTMVHMGIVKQPSSLNVINSVLRKFHDAKIEYAKTLP